MRVWILKVPSGAHPPRTCSRFDTKLTHIDGMEHVHSN